MNLYIFALILIFVAEIFSIRLRNDFSCEELHSLYNEGKHLINIQKLYDNLLIRNQVTMPWYEIGYSLYNSEFSQSMSFNISEEYYKAKVFSQTASLFYDQIMWSDFEKDIPNLFQNYSHCFFDAARVQKKIKKVNDNFSSITGNGNNIKYPQRGESFTSFGRLLKAQYDDNIHSIRKSGRGYELPSPRNIVRKLFLNDKRNLNKLKQLSKIPNMMSIMFAQFISHDVGSRQITGNGEGIRCCTNFNKNQLPKSLMHSSCLPITVSRSDPFYSPHNIKCMAFFRSNIISNNPYKIDVGEQVNGVTSYLDLSQIYASDFERMRKVRSFNGGRLKVDIKNILPLAENGKYFSGDNRAMQTPFLAIIYSLFVRNHNNIADKLGALNRHWNEERLFQESRKINVAIYQKIIYEEWLELFVSSESADQLKHTEYNINADASTLNEFSTAAFRIFHAFLPSSLEIRDENMTEVSLNLSDLLNKSELLNYYEDILRGMTNQKMNLLGYSNEILNRMFKNQNKIGIDLLSMDIMRGRDHGIPAYHKFIKMCNLTSNSIKVFNDLAPLISKESIIQLRQTYKTVYDIDLIVGVALENVKSSMTSRFGSTFECIMNEQFNRWKSGDFYFYSHKSSFTGDQLKVIQNYKLANFLCDNSNLKEIKSDAFLSGSTSVKCSKLEKFDFSLWKEFYEQEEED